MYSPRWLFLYPGSALIVLGAVGCAWLLPQSRVIGGLWFDARSLVYAFAAVLIGFQFVAFAVFTKVFAISEGLLPDDPRLTRAFRYITLEIGLAVGTVLVVLGLGGTVFGFLDWIKQEPWSLDRVLRLALSSVFSLTLGAQVICSSFFLSILGLRRRSVSRPVAQTERTGTGS
jgi:hypothetical protein